LPLSELVELALLLVDGVLLASGCVLPVGAVLVLLVGGMVLTLAPEVEPLELVSVVVSVELVPMELLGVLLASGWVLPVGAVLVLAEGSVLGVVVELLGAVASLEEVEAAEGLADVEDEAVLFEHVSEIIFTESTL